MIAKHRLDGLTDALFGVAMTLLVLDLRLPEALLPRDGAELLRAIADLSTQFLAYAISFFVLARRWMGLAALAGRVETITDRFAGWSLAHLFLIACIPFSTMLVGRFDQFAISTWVYALNTILAALVMLRLLSLSGAAAGERAEWQRGLIALVVVALVSVIVSFARPSEAMWAYVLLLLMPFWQKFRTRKRA
jgi:uncharacterized membrane protein